MVTRSAGRLSETRRPRPSRTLEGVRHTALAARNDLEKRKDDSRGRLKIFCVRWSGGAHG